MRGVGLRIGRGVPVKKRQQMRGIARAVAAGCIHRFLDRNIDGGAGHLKRGKGPRVQFIDKRIAQGVVRNGRHGTAFDDLART